MARARTTRTLIVHLDEESEEVLTRAAQLRRIDASDYVRQVAIAQARNDVVAASEQTIAMTPDEQLAFWIALDSPIECTSAQRDSAR